MLSPSQAAAVAAAIKYGVTVSVLGNGTHHVRIGPMGNSADFRVTREDVNYVVSVFEELENLRAQSINSSPKLCECPCSGQCDVLCDDQREEVPSDPDEQREHVSTEVVSDPDLSVGLHNTGIKRRNRKPSD